MSATKILSGQVFLFGSRLVLKIATPVPTMVDVDGQVDGRERLDRGRWAHGE
jgi:hypothetical protein